MPINISQAMRKKLPEGERVTIDQALWDKSGGRCHLCEEPLNRAADDIQADHDFPESEGGATDLATQPRARVLQQGEAQCEDRPDQALPQANCVR